MTAYWIVDVNISDPVAFEAYKAEVPGLIARHGGVYVVVGGAQEVTEGTWQPTFLVMVRFPDRAAIHAFLSDPDYAPLKALRLEAATTHAIAVDGLS